MNIRLVLFLFLIFFACVPNGYNKASVVNETDKVASHNHNTRDISDTEERLALVEDKIMVIKECLQDSRELAVWGSNGVCTGEDRKKMAVKIDEYLHRMILEANSKYKDDYLFSWYMKFIKPFETLEGAVHETTESMINEFFLAKPFAIYSYVYTEDFRLTSDQSVMIDGVKIQFKAGDNNYTIAKKINAAPIDVKAHIDHTGYEFLLRSTKQHKIEVSDIEGGNVFRQLGILETATGQDNYSRAANVIYGSSMSIFDVMIMLRDAMLQNNVEDIGLRCLKSIDSAIENTCYLLAEFGERMFNLNEGL